MGSERGSLCTNLFKDVFTGVEEQAEEGVAARDAGRMFNAGGIILAACTLTVRLMFAFSGIAFGSCAFGNGRISGMGILQYHRQKSGSHTVGDSLRGIYCGCWRSCPCTAKESFYLFPFF